MKRGVGEISICMVNHDKIIIGWISEVNFMLMQCLTASQVTTSFWRESSTCCLIFNLFSIKELTANLI